MSACRSIEPNYAAEGLTDESKKTLFGRWRAARAQGPVRVYGLAGRRRQWALTCTFPGLEALCLCPSAGASVVGCSSLSSIRTRPDLASIDTVICFIALFFKTRVQWAGSKVLAHLYKKYRVPLLTKKYSVKVLMPNLRRLSLNASQITCCKGNAFSHNNKS